MASFVFSLVVAALGSALGGALGGALGSAQIGASDPAIPTPSRVAGRIVKPGADSVVPVAGHWVTLHRVGTDHAGPVDSTRSGSGGQYGFVYQRTGASDAIYFVSSSYGGVAYFTSPLHDGVDSGDDTEITVFDTTSHAVPVSVRGRHLIVSRPESNGSRTVTEVFELSNDSSVTRVARDESPTGAVWSSVLPAHAVGPQVADGDIPAAAVRFVNGRALVYAPLAPGMKQLAFHYTLPSEGFPLSISIARPASVLEVLVEEPTGRADGAHLQQVASVAVEGHQFRRFFASDAAAGGSVVVRVPEATRPLTAWFVAGLTLVIGGTMTGALARALRRR